MSSSFTQQPYVGLGALPNRCSVYFLKAKFVRRRWGSGASSFGIHRLRIGGGGRPRGTFWSESTSLVYSVMIRRAPMQRSEVIVWLQELTAYPRESARPLSWILQWQETHWRDHWREVPLLVFGFATRHCDFSREFTSSVFVSLFQQSAWKVSEDNTISREP